MTSKDHTSRQPLLLATLCLLLLSSLTACDQNDLFAKPDHDTIHKLRSDSPFVRDDNPIVTPPENKPEDKVQYVIYVERVIFPRDNKRTTNALKQLPPLEFKQKHIQHAWKANGLNISQIDPLQLKLFKANLPAPLGTSPTSIPMVDNFSPLTLVSRIRGTMKLKLNENAGTHKIHNLISGKLQLLLRITKDKTNPDANPYFEIIPHHYAPRLTIKIRDTADKIFDGTSFSNLHLYETFDPKKTWVIWADLPKIIDAKSNNIITPTKPAPPKVTPAKPIQNANPDNPDNKPDAIANPKNTNNTQTPPDTNNPDTKKTPEPAQTPPQNLKTETFTRMSADPVQIGEAMLSGFRQRTPARVLLIITLHKLDHDNK